MWCGVRCCNTAVIDVFFTPNITAVCLPWGQVRPLTSPPSKTQVLPQALDCVSGQKKQWACEVSLCEWVGVGGGGQGSTEPYFKKLATFQEFDTSLEIPKGVKSTLATNYSLINPVESWADGRPFFKGYRTRWVCGCRSRFGVVLIAFCVGRRGHQDVLANMRRAFASTYCSLPSIRLFVPATAQVFGHIPAAHTAAQPIQRGSAIGLLQRYLIGLIGAQKRHSYKIGFLIKSRRQKNLQIKCFHCFFQWNQRAVWFPSK